MSGSRTGITGRLARAWPRSIIWRRPEPLPGEHGTDPAEPPHDATGDGSAIRLLIQFLSELGAAMNGAGEATTFIRRTLQRIGRAYGLQNLGVFVVPTLLLLRYGNNRSTFVDLSSRIPTDLRLDQTAALYLLVREAEQGSIEPAEGMNRLRAILQAPARFAAPARVFSVCLITEGILLTLRPSLQELLLAAGLALIVGLVSFIGERWPQLWPLMPAAAGLLVGMLAYFAIDMGAECRPLFVLVPPLAIFLPGTALTVSMIELSNADIVAGGSRLAYGMIRLFLLVFGVLIGAQLSGVAGPSADFAANTLDGRIAVLGLVIFTFGVFVYTSAPPGSFVWLLAVVAAAWAGKQLGVQVLGISGGGFLGGAIMVIAAQSISVRRNAPPLIVSFTPAFWLLVPGAIGLQGLSKIFQESPVSGLDDILSMLVTMVAIALGVLFGLIVSGSERTREPA